MTIVTRMMKKPRGRGSLTYSSAQRPDGYKTKELFRYSVLTSHQRTTPPHAAAGAAANRGYRRPLKVRIVAGDVLFQPVRRTSATRPTRCGCITTVGQLTNQPAAGPVVRAILGLASRRIQNFGLLLRRDNRQAARLVNSWMLTQWSCFISASHQIAIEDHRRILTIRPSGYRMVTWLARLRGV